MPRIRPQEGPQTTFSATPADIALYGGSAGGGKSWALAYEAARYVHVQNYAAVIFRRTSPELTGGGSIWEEAHKLYPHIGGVPRQSPTLEFTFPRHNSRIEFRHLQYEHTVQSHQSKQYDSIFFDELTHFTPLQFWYMLSRARSGTAAPKRIRGSCNPDPDSFVRELIDWYIGEDGLAIEARSGVIRWFARLNERLIWGDSPDEVTSYDPIRIRRWGTWREEGDDRAEPMSFTFVRAKASDNKILMRGDPTYLSRLNLLTGAQAKRLRDGNWDARDVAGDYFDRSWCPIVDRIEEGNVRRRVRFWDKAATSPSPASPDPDYTRGPRLAELDDGRYVLEDLASLRAGPADVDKLMLSTARIDGVPTEIGAWIDPGQAGKVDELHMQTLLLGYSFSGIAARQNKIVYARVWSPIAKAGRLLFLRREYLPELFAEAEGFPAAAHDDIMDGISGCFQKLVGGLVEFAYDAAPDTRHGPPTGNAWDDQDDDDSSKGRGMSRGACF